MSDDLYAGERARFTAALEVHAPAGDQADRLAAAASRITTVTR